MNLNGCTELASPGTDCSVVALIEMPPQLESLKARAQAVPLRGHKLVIKSVSCLEGAVGRFFEPRVGRNPVPVIGLKSGRSELETWQTLAHELGHYCSWATMRRSVCFTSIEDKYARRMAAMSAHIRVAAGGRDRRDPEVYGPLLAAAKLAIPQDLGEQFRHEILDEELRAWCFAAELAASSNFDKSNLIIEAKKALSCYFVNLDLPEVSWAPDSCPPLGDVGRAFIDALVV